MATSYFTKSKEAVKGRFGVNLLEDVLFNRKDRVLLYSDSSETTKNLELHVILGSLTTFGFLERASITTDELFSHFDGNNQYAYVAGRKEYYDYVKDLFYQRNHYSEVTFPIRVNGKCIWLSVEITPYKEFGDLVLYTIKDRTELMTEEEQKWLRAHTDSLTGLFNKYTLDYHYGIRSHRDPLHVIYLDIDNFKDVNDTYGHYAGDSTLIRFANILKSHESEYNKFYRVGGDEFVGLFFEDEAYVRKTVESILKQTKALEAETQLEGFFSVSIGVIKATHKSDLIRKADMLLYRVKKEGKDGYLYEIEKV